MVPAVLATVRHTATWLSHDNVQLLIKMHWHPYGPLGMWRFRCPVGPTVDMEVNFVFIARCFRGVKVGFDENSFFFEKDRYLVVSLSINHWRTFQEFLTDLLVSYRKITCRSLDSPRVTYEKSST